MRGPESASSRRRSSIAAARKRSRVDPLQRLAIDPGQRTLAELLREREWARAEILTLRRRLAERGRRRGGAGANGGAGATRRQVRADRTTSPSADPPGDAPADRMLRLGEVALLVGVGRGTINAWIAKGSFPRQVRLDRRRVGWRFTDIVAWQKGLLSS